MRKVERIKVTCAHCGTVFRVRESRHRVYCSQACGNKAQIKERPVLTCKHCGVAFEVEPKNSGRLYCSIKCKNTAQSRATAQQRSEKMRGKGTAPDGGLLPTTYPKLHGRHAHRVVAEETLGRPLEPGEIVHHDDENKHNYDPSNLVVLPSQGDHARLHHTKGRLAD